MHVCNTVSRPSKCMIAFLTFLNLFSIKRLTVSVAWSSHRVSLSHWVVTNVAWLLLVFCITCFFRFRANTVNLFDSSVESLTVWRCTSSRRFFLSSSCCQLLKHCWTVSSFSIHRRFVCCYFSTAHYISLQYIVNWCQNKMTAHACAWKSIIFPSVLSFFEHRPRRSIVIRHCMILNSIKHCHVFGSEPDLKMSAPFCTFWSF